MEGSRTPLAKWAAAIRFLSTRKSINAKQLAAAIAVTYKTAWSMLRNIRAALLSFDEELPLSGPIAAGVAFYGRRYYHTYVRHPQQHPMIVACAYGEGGTPSYIKIKHVHSAFMDEKRLLLAGEHHFRLRHVKDGASIKISSHLPFYKHITMQQVFSQAKAWLNNTFGGLGTKYLDAYFAEYCFRLHTFLHKTDPYERILAVCLRQSRSAAYVSRRGSARSIAAA